MATRVEKTDKQWREELTPEQYDVLRKGATERAFTGRYWDAHDDGIYRCAACKAELFSSDTKFESGTGWPSFTEPKVAEAVELRPDRSWGMDRTEVVCRRAAAISAISSTTARATPEACGTASTPARSSSTAR